MVIIIALILAPFVVRYIDDKYGDWTNIVIREPSQFSTIVYAVCWSTAIGLVIGS